CGRTHAIERARLEAWQEIADSGDVRQRLGARIARYGECPQLARLDVLGDCRYGGEHDVRPPAQQVDDRGSGTPIGHMHDIDACRHLEQYARDVADASDTG